MKHDDVTLVLQGPLHTRSGALCRGIYNIPIYKEFVGPLIISTWKHDGIKPAKRFLKNNNATYIEDNPKKYKNMYSHQNVNLQIASSLNGIREVKTKYVIKVRCDEQYEDLSIFIDTMKRYPERLVTQEPFNGIHNFKNETDTDRIKNFISDHVMGGLTTKIMDMFNTAYTRCCDYDVPRKQLPEDLLRSCFKDQNIWVSIEDFGDFVFKMQTDRVTRSLYMKMKRAGGCFLSRQEVSELFK